MADKSGVYKYYNGSSYENIYFKTKGALVEQDASHRFISDNERSLWNSKAGTGLANSKANGLMSAADKNKLDSLIDIIYPVGSIYMSTNAVNPSTIFNKGTWQAWGQGRVPVGIGTGTDSNKLSRTFKSGEVSGEYNHTLTINEMPRHEHEIVMTHGDNFVIPNRYGTGGACTDEKTQGHWFTGSVIAAATGGSGSHNNMPPYITCYMWRRVA